jgi:hypothetical protein
MKHSRFSVISLRRELGMKSVKPQQGRRALPYAIAAVLLIVAPTAAQADFSGPYTPSNWTFSNGSQDGSVDTSGAPASITLTGADLGDAVNTDFTITAAGTGNVSFSFQWSSLDEPGLDSGGFLLNDAFTLLADTDGASGSQSFPVNVGDTIGFRVTTEDALFGPGVLTISNFSAPAGVVSTPEPGTLILMALGAAGLAVGRLRRRDN